MARETPFPERLMAWLDGEMTAEEADEFERQLDEHPEWREEAQMMAEIHNAAEGKAFRQPPPEVWDNYWEEIDSRLSKGFGWIFLALGGLILVTAGVVKVLTWAQNMYVKAGIVMILAGFLVLFISVLRGRLVERAKDRYRKIRR